MSNTGESVEINCFGCGPTNPLGLKLVFDTGHHECRASFALGSDYESYPGVIHGGIVATILDETMAQAVYRYSANSAFTVGLRIRYAQPMATGVSHIAFAKITPAHNAVIQASGRILRETGELVAAATGTFYPISENGLEAMRLKSGNEGPRVSTQRLNTKGE